MDPIEVPYTDETSLTPCPERHVVSWADLLLTAALREDTALLWADYTGGLAWHVRSPGREAVVAVNSNWTPFRATLARFGHHYMSGQLYGGFSEGLLTQRGRTFHFAMYMANDQWRGYWLRAYVRPTAVPCDITGSEQTASDEGS